MAEVQKTTLANLLNAESNQVNPLISQSVDETIEFSETTQTITPPRIGDYWNGQGGYYAGIVRDGKHQWHLLLAAKSVGHIESEWGKYSNNIRGDFSARDGLQNTCLILASEPENEIANHFTALLIDGHKDFYWPAKFEQNLICINLPEEISPEWHWSSTQYSAYLAWFQHFEDGTQGFDFKYCRYAARAVRRILIIE